MAPFMNLGADDPFGLHLSGFGLHSFHGKLTRIVEGLGEIHHLDVLSRVLEEATKCLMCDMVDAIAHHQSKRPVAGTKQGPEILAAEIACKGLTIRSAMTLAVVAADSRADRQKLCQG